MDEFESRLRQFRPRRPAAIPDERLQLLRGPIWLAVAAGMAAALLIAAWWRTPSTRQASLDAAALTTLALENPEAFDAELSRISQTSLPDVTVPGATGWRLP
jgi:hypothetical protein